MTQPLSNSPTCKVCGEVESHYLHGYHAHPDARYHPFKPALLSNSEGQTVAQAESSLTLRVMDMVANGNDEVRFALYQEARTNYANALIASAASAIAPSAEVERLRSLLATAYRVEDPAAVIATFELRAEAAESQLAPLISVARAEAAKCETYSPSFATWCGAHKEDRPCVGDRLRAAIPSADSESA